MTMFERGVDEVEHPSRLDRKVSDAVALGRWINPVLGALGTLVLTGYLMIGNPAAAVATTPAPVAEMRPATTVSVQLTPSNERAIISHSGVARDEATGSSKVDVLNAALGTMLASAWLMGGAWVGIRSARISTPLDEPKSDPHLRNRHLVGRLGN